MEINEGKNKEHRQVMAASTCYKPVSVTTMRRGKAVPFTVVDVLKVDLMQLYYLKHICLSINNSECN